MNSLFLLFLVGGENSLISHLVLYGLTRGRRACRVRASVRRGMLLRIGPDNRAEVVERSSLVMLFNLLNACCRQDRLCQVLSSHVVVKVPQIALVADFGQEWGGNLLLEKLLDVDLSEERVQQDVIHVLVLAKSFPPVLG